MQSSIICCGSILGASAITAAAKQRHIKVIQTETIEECINVIAETPFAMLFAHAPEAPPAEICDALRTAKIDIPVIICGPVQPAANAAKAIRLGAIEYLSTPLEDALIPPLLDKITPPETADTTQGPIAGDSKTHALLDQAKNFANSNASVLLRGESGTGKEVFSSFIHTNSPRKDKPFIAVNCAAIPENLLESELFGYEKGAFSGALSKRIGKFQQADGGTLLLDEISEMDLALQAKLLRAIQERVIDPIGSTQSVPVDIRLIATTNRKLEEYVAEGKFREDLYFRLNVIALEIPPLRERVGDIAPLANYFVQKYAAQNNRENLTLSNDSISKLEECYWKGNVRELENTLHRAVLMVGSDEHSIKPEHIILSPMSLSMMQVEPSNKQAAQAATQGPLPQTSAAAQRYAAAGADFSTGTGGHSPIIGRSLQDMEQELILSTLKHYQGNRALAADVLGISVKILKDKLVQLGLEPAAQS